MKFNLNVEVPAEALEHTETSALELARILVNTAEAVLRGDLVKVGDAVMLHDLNGDQVGVALFEPSRFEVGDEVWDNSTMRDCVVVHVADTPAGMQEVHLRDALTSEPRGSWSVFPDGRDMRGRCWMSRRVKP